MKRLLTAICVLAMGISTSGCGFWPPYNAWAKEQSGKGDYAKAVQDRRIKVLEAQAAMDSAKMYADAEVARARGTESANEIMQRGLGGPENYLRWRYIHMLEETAGKGDRQVIYLPTEAGMPVLEAGKRKE